MNERIQGLAKQAGITTNLDTDHFEKDPNKWMDYFAEKFAELLIRECAKTGRGIGGINVSRAILNKFGVEE